MFKNIVLDLRGSIAILTLNNPQNRNALTEEMKDEIIAAIEHVEYSLESKALIITGRGPAFCAGGDIKKIGQVISPEEVGQIMRKSQMLLLKFINLEKPVVAAVNGDAYGMGFNLILTADFAIASENARFSQIFVRLGLLPDFGALYHLPRLIGITKAKELLYLGKTISAHEAKDLGLLFKVVPADILEKEAVDIARQLAELPTKAIGYSRKLLGRTFEMTLEELLKEEIRIQRILSQTEEHRKAIEALLESKQHTVQKEEK